jgi:predicted flap endonuclease-1-like 5' DNA nuclease
MKNPPILIAVIGFFAALAGFGYLFFGLRVLGFDWFGVLGDLPALEHLGLWGWLAVAVGVVWLLIAIGLWALQPWAWLTAMIIAGFSLFEAVIAFFQFPGTGIGFAMAIMPVIILLYLNSYGVKVAFGIKDPAPAAAAAAVSPAPLTAPPAAASAVVATVAAASPSAPAAVAAPPPQDTADPAPVRVEDVEGIGPAYADKLLAAGIKTTSDLLTAGAKQGGRDRIAETTGISEKLILAWVNKVDLMRIPGVGTQYSDLLEAAGVDSPAELALRNPANLAVTFQEVVAARPGIVRRIPPEVEIAAWMDEARKLTRVVEH